MLENKILISGTNTNSKVFESKNLSLQVVYLQICYKSNLRDVVSVCYLSIILKNPITLQPYSK